MRKTLALFVTLLLGINGGALAAAATAKPASQPFQFKDWEVACDNTRRCQAVGYAPEGGLEGVTWDPVAVLLTREAGPNAPVTVELIAPEANEAKKGGNGKWLVQLESTRLPPVAAEQAWTAAAAQALVAALPKLENFKVSRGSDVRFVSLAGSNAALLKMDDLQGRVGAPGALLRKGDKPESAVLPPLAPPVVAAKAFATASKADNALIKPVLAAVKNRECWGDLPNDAEAETGIVRVSATQVMVTRQCWRAAYQSGSAAWLANAAAPHNPVPVVFSGVDGREVEMPSELSIRPDGYASSAMKGRGIGDCWEIHEWAWTGQRFELTKAAASVQCRLIPGGVPLRLWTSRKQ